MILPFKQKRHIFLVYLLIIALLFGCSAPRYLEVGDIKKETSAKIYLSGGSVVEGLITARSDTGIAFVNEKDHQVQTFQLSDIRRIEKSAKNFDFQGNLISDAEIGQYKSSRNAWGYALGGAALGGLFGILVGLPFWYADTGIPPYFVGGIGATASSIFFGIRGTQKDREIAVRTVRYLREGDTDLQKEKDEEERKLEELRKQQDELKKRISKDGD